MSYTIATLYRGDLCETYVALFEGSLTEAQEQEIAYRLDLKSEDGDDLDWVGFCSAELQDPTEAVFYNSTQGDLRVYAASDFARGEERSSIYRGIE